MFARLAITELDALNLDPLQKFLCFRFRSFQLKTARDIRGDDHVTYGRHVIFVTVNLG